MTKQGILCIILAIIIWVIGYVYNDLKLKRSTMIPEETSMDKKEE